MLSETDLLRTFVATYRAGSVTKAAAGLRLTQPAVSMQLQRLERRIGQRLFDRGPLGMTPTAAGHDLARRAAAPLAALESIFQPPSDQPALAGTLRLGGPADFLSELALPALAPLIQAKVRLEVTTGMASDLLSALSEDRLDVVVSAVRPTGPDLEYEALYDEQFSLLCAPRWAGREHRDIPLLAFSADLPIIRRYWRTVFRARIGRSAALVIPDLRGLREAACAGAGMTVLPTYLVRGELESGRLVELASPAHPPRNTLYLCWRKGGPDNPRLDAARGALTHAAGAW